LESKYTKSIGFTILVTGILLIAAGSLFNPNFVATYFSSTGILNNTIIQAILVFELSIICLGLLAIASGFNLIYPVKAQKLLEFITPVGKKLDSRRIHLLFCIICASIALAIGLSITKLGPNLSADSIGYIVTGENIFDGTGFQNYMHSPLYPAAIAGFMHFGCDAMQAARLIPVLSFTLLIFPLFYLAKTLGNTLIGCIVCLVCAVLAPLLRIASYAWVDMLYILILTTAILFMVLYLRIDHNKIKILCVGAFFTALCIVTSLYGIALLLTGLVIIVIKNRDRLKTACLHIILFGTISALPGFLWICRNIVLFSRPMAGGNPSNTEPIVWIKKSVFWIATSIPNELFRPVVEACQSSTQVVDSPMSTDYCTYLMPIILVILFILLTTYLIKSSRQKARIEHLRETHVPILYAVIHLGGIIIGGTIIFLFLDQRYLTAIYPFIILVSAILIFYIYEHIKRPSLKPIWFFSISIFCLWFLFLQIINCTTFYGDFKNGKGFNNAFWRNNPATAWIINNVPVDSMIYSNNWWGICLRIENPSDWLPFAETGQSIDGFFKELNYSDNSYIVGFKEKYRKGRNPQIANEVIIEANQRYNILTVVADFPEATIWHVNH
jgi:hypothetical protein